VAVTYDANGNTLGYDVDGTGPKLPRSFTYDGENRPVAVTQNGNTSAFAYAPDGERAGETYVGNSFYYMGTDAELLVNGVNPAGLLTSYLNADVKREGGITSWGLKDHLASNRLMTYMAGGQATSRHDYGPYGNPLTTNGSTILQGKSYINERFDPETGLQYLHARYYDPDLGRFLTPDTWDPTIAEVDVNRYAYAGNDPVNFSDANGHLSTAAWTLATELGAAAGFSQLDSPVPGPADAVAVGMAIGAISHYLSAPSATLPNGDDEFTRREQQQIEDRAHQLVRGGKPLMEAFEKAKDEVRDTRDNLRHGLVTDRTGKFHGTIPNSNDFDKSSKDAIRNSIDSLKKSIATRVEEMIKKGYNTTSAVAHMRRLQKERELLRSLEKKLENQKDTNKTDKKKK
jgi:RHS repeat-associated protein